MEIVDYLLGKKSGGGTDINEYFISNNVLESNLYPQSMIKKFPYNISLKNKSTGSTMFYNFANLESVVLRDCEDITNTNNMFANCLSLKFIDIRDLLYTNVTSGRMTIFGTLTGTDHIPYDCLIIVKDNEQKQNLLSVPNFSRLTNIKTVEEYEQS